MSPQDEIVWIGCKIKIIDDKTNPDLPRWKTIGQCIYTPKAINDFLKENGLNNAWAFYLGNKELWFKSDERLAKKG